MIQLKIRWDARSMAKTIRKKEEVLKGNDIKVMLWKATVREKNKIVDKTPKRWTGNAKKSWKVRKSPLGLSLTIYTTSQVAKWLNDGTKAHGPTHAKFLFIPLTHRAMLAQRRGVFPQGRSRLVFGIDYILTKRVRGIRKMKLLQGSEKRILRDVAQQLKTALR